jgi:hypothetical protein
LLAPMFYFSMVSQRPVCGATTQFPLMVNSGTDAQSNRALYDALMSTTARCAECSHHFSVYRLQQRFCSDNCRVRHFRRRQAEHYKALEAENVELRQQLGEGGAA